jgi:rubrerythrin
MDFQQSRTFQNLQNAFIGESITSTRYGIYGKHASQEGYIQISNVFENISHVEREHAIIWLRILNNGELPTTYENVRDAADSEGTDGVNTYREYASIAREEGYNDIAALFEGVANIELNHETIFDTFERNFETNEIFCKPVESLWVCINCGNIMGGLCAPEICPICFYPQGYYQIYNPIF